MSYFMKIKPFKDIQTLVKIFTNQVCYNLFSKSSRRIKCCENSIENEIIDILSYSRLKKSRTQYFNVFNDFWDGIRVILGFLLNDEHTISLST